MKGRVIRLLDRVLSGGMWKQLGLLTVCVVVILGVFMLVAGALGVDLFSGDSAKGQGLWGIYYHFVDSGNQYVVAEGWRKFFAALISLSGSILLGGVLISTISNIIERRVEDYQKGRVYYKNMADHYVIIGYGEMTLSLIKRLLSPESINMGYPDKEYASDGKSVVVILTKQDIETIRLSVHSMLSEEEEKRVVFYHGDIESMEMLKKLRVEKSRMIFIQGEQKEYGRDTKNIECVKNLSEIISACPDVPAGRQFRTFVQFDRIPSYSLVQKLTLPKEYRKHIYFLPFNFHENWARMLWSYYRGPEEGYRPLDYEVITSDSDSFVHLFVFGFNRMGRALTLEAIRLCHYANYASRKVKTKITIVDMNMAALWDFFCTQYPYLYQVEDVEIETIEARVDRSVVRDRLVEAARTGECLLTVAICLKDPDLSLATGLNLPDEVYAAGSSVLVRQELQCGLANVVNAVSEGKYGNVKAFGMLNHGIDLRMAKDTLATYVHGMWKVGKEKGFDYAQKWVETLHLKSDAEIREFRNQAILWWGELSEEQRWSNRYSIDTFDMYLRSVGKKLVKMKTKQEINIDTITDDDVKVLAPMEHCRWIAERSLAGWRQAKTGEQRDDGNCVHVLLVPYETLPPSEQCKDQGNVRNMAMFLALEGYEIVETE